MLIVPILGDRVETAENLPFKVLSFTNLKADGPAISCEGAGGVVEDIQFSDISTINGRKVKVVKNAKAYNVFEAEGFFERKFQLPQPGESVESDDTTYKVSRIKLHVKNQLAKGLIFECVEKDSELTKDLSLNDIAKVKHTLFSRSKFLAYYSDYKDTGSR